MDDRQEPIRRRRTARPAPPPAEDYPYGYDDEPAYPEPGPTDAEIDEWAAAERRRREAWIAGPSDAEKRAWARREQRRRQRRAAFADDFPGRDMAEYDDLEARFRRDAELLVEGAMISFWRWPFRLLADTARAGRTWEAEQELRPGRRRVPYFADDF